MFGEVNLITWAHDPIHHHLSLLISFSRGDKNTETGASSVQYGGKHYKARSYLIDSPQFHIIDNGTGSCLFIYFIKYVINVR